MPETALDRCDVLVIHGIGEELRGATLSDIGDPLARFITTHASGAKSVRVETENLSPTIDTLAQSTITFSTELGEQHEIRLQEAWWAARFIPPSYTSVLTWTLNIWWSQVKSILVGILTSLNAAEPVELRHQHQRPQDSPGEMTPDPIYESPDPTWLSRGYDLVMGLALAVIFTIGAPLVVVLIVIAWSIQGLGGVLGLPAPFQTASALLEQVYVRYVGDIYTYFRLPHARASIRRAVTEPLEQLIREGRRICIVSHSWGTVVALDALLDLAQSREAPLPPLTLITVGAALNRVWWLGKTRQRDTDEIRRFWTEVSAHGRWLEPVRWVNIWSRYDPVPAGPCNLELRKALADAGAWVVERRVVNLDDPSGDHTSYWENAPEVQSRLLHEMLNRKPVTGIVQAVESAVSRRRWVGLLATVRLIMIALGVMFALNGAAPLIGLSGVQVSPIPLAQGLIAAAIFYGLLIIALIGQTWGPRASALLAGVAAVTLVALVVSPGISEYWRAAQQLATKQTAIFQTLATLVLIFGSYKVIRYGWFSSLLEER
jgi:hypothetical protein